MGCYPRLVGKPLQCKITFAVTANDDSFRQHFRGKKLIVSRSDLGVVSAWPPRSQLT
jgi:hypothetical protein